MSRVTASRLLDLGGFDGWDVVNVSVGPDGDPLVLLWERPASLPLDPMETRIPGITAWRRRVAGPNRFRLVHYHAGGHANFKLPETSQNYGFAQPLPGGDYLVVAKWPRDDQPNAGVYSADGRLLRSFPVGEGVHHVQTTSGGKIWVGYIDEGIFGNDDLGRDGVNCFDTDGRVSFGFNELAMHNGLDSIADCYAMNVVSDDETWLWYYMEFPLVRVQDDWIHDYRPDMVDKAPISGSSAFAMAGDRVLFRGGYRDRDRLYLMSIDGPRSQELVPVDTDGEPIMDFRAFGRCSRFYLKTADALFVIDAARLPEW